MGCAAVLVCIGACSQNTLPTVVATTPEAGATDVPTNQALVVTFSKEMDATTISEDTFTLTRDATPVAGTVSISGDKATFTPESSLAPNTLYTATIKSGVESLKSLGSFNNTRPSDSTPENNTAIFGQRDIEYQDGCDVGPLCWVGGISLASILTGVIAGLGCNGTAPPTALEADFVWTFTTGETTAQDSIDLGSAAAFAILAGSTVENTGNSTVAGDLGVSPGTAVVGFPPGVLDGSEFTGVGSAAGEAKLDLTTAFNDAAGRTDGPISLAGDLSGLTLYPGLYANSTSVMLSAGTVTLDALGDPDAVFIFQMGSTLTTEAGTQIILAGDAKAANIYWQVGSSATLGTTSIFKGNILAQESITLATGATLEGRALTQTAAVTLDAAVIAVPVP